MSGPQLDWCIAIDDLPLELRQMRKGGVYCMGVALEADAFSMVRQIIVNAEPHSRAVLISTKDPSDILTGLTSEQGPQDIRGYRLVGEPSRALRALPKALDARLSPRGRSIMLLLSDEIISGLPDPIESILLQWSKWLIARGCMLLILLHGERAPKVAAGLSPLNHVLSGVAQLKSRGSQRLYQISHWRNALGVTGQTEAVLAQQSGRFRVAESTAIGPSWAEDHDQLLLEQDVLGAVPLVLQENWQVLDDAEQLYKAALRASAATVVFVLQDESALIPLARTVHSLRRQRGQALKIVLRETKRVLRYQDEQMLLACGATLVIPAGADVSRFLSLLESIQGQVFTRELAVDLEGLIESRLPVQQRGIIGPDSFLACLEQVQNRPVNHGVLVVMKPVPGLLAAYAMGQLNLRRVGDVACQLNGAVYVYLFGCRSSLVEVVLARIFRLPYQEMFTDHLVCATEALISAQIVDIRRALRDASAMPAGRRDGFAEEPRDELGRVPRHAHQPTSPLRPQLRALPIVGLNGNA